VIRWDSRNVIQLHLIVVEDLNVGELDSELFHHLNEIVFGDGGGLLAGDDGEDAKGSALEREG
jgi:hypothetical protein